MKRSSTPARNAEPTREAAAPCIVASLLIATGLNVLIAAITAGGTSLESYFFLFHLLDRPGAPSDLGLVLLGVFVLGGLCVLAWQLGLFLFCWLLCRAVRG